MSVLIIAGIEKSAILHISYSVLRIYVSTVVGIAEINKYVVREILLL